MKISRRDIMKFFGAKLSHEIRIDVDSDLLKNIEYIHYVAFRNECTPRIIRTLIVNFGLSCIMELVEREKITSFFHLLKILKTSRNSLKEYVEVAQEEEPLIQIGVMKRIHNEFKMRKYNDVLREAFYDYLVSMNKEVVGEKVLLDRDDLKKIFVAFETSMLKHHKLEGE